MSAAHPANVCHIIGLDLGQVSDPSALVVLERTETPGGNTYFCGHLQRWTLGTGYPVIVSDTLALLDRPDLKDPTLVVDQTGVGRAVVDMFRHHPGRRGGFRPVTITAGLHASEDADGSHHTPKKDLVGTLQVLLGQRRLEIARGLPGRDVLYRELQNFRVKITAAANETFGAWREGEHDDLVLAVALAAWVGEHCWVGPWDYEPPRGARSEMAKAPPDLFLTGAGDNIDWEGYRR
jgi:hypothetical protein